jgi:hypothetical protein
MFVCNGGITEPFLFCKPLPETTKGQAILDVVDIYFSSHDLSWKSCISKCMDGAPSMSESLEGFITLAKQKNSGIVLHIASLDEIIKMVNYIKSRPLQLRMFSALCSDMETAHTQLLLHMEVRWLP